MLIGVARDAHLLHEVEILEEHQMVVVLIIAEVLKLSHVEVERAAIHEGVLEGEDGVLEVSLLIGCLNEGLDRGIASCECLIKLLCRVPHRLVDVVALAHVVSATQGETVQVKVDLLNLRCRA